MNIHIILLIQNNLKNTYTKIFSIVKNIIMNKII